MKKNLQDEKTTTSEQSKVLAALMVNTAASAITSIYDHFNDEIFKVMSTQGPVKLDAFLDYLTMVCHGTLFALFDQHVDNDSTKETMDDFVEVFVNKLRLFTINHNDIFNVQKK